MICCVEILIHAPLIHKNKSDGCDPNHGSHIAHTCPLTVGDECFFIRWLYQPASCAFLGAVRDQTKKVHWTQVSCM